MTKRLAIQVAVAIVVGVFALGIWASGDRIDPGWLRFFGAAVLAVTLCWTLWDQLLWRLPPFQLLRRIPRNLRGTWRGELRSLWVDPETGRPPAAKTVYLVVRQTASAVSVTHVTDESRSRSSLAKVSTVDGQAQLDYLYLNKPVVRVEHRSRIHHGSTSLDVVGQPATRLAGRYWTDRGTRGELDFTSRHKGLADDYESAAALFGGAE